jgi:hypothetical protein
MVAAPPPNKHRYGSCFLIKHVPAEFRSAREGQAENYSGYISPNI